jgi:signal transduction histidine kinase
MLVQETEAQFGLLIFLPIYSAGLPHATVEERRQNLQSYATGVFRIGDMIEASLSSAAWQDIALRLYDASAPPGKRLLYSRPGLSPGRPERAVDEAGRESTSGFQWGISFVMAGRQWTLRFSPTPAYLATQRTWQAWLVLACGLLLAGLLGAFLLLLTGRTASIERTNTALEREITERHRAQEELAYANDELRRSNQDLEHFAYVASHDLKAPLRGITQLATWIEEDLTHVLKPDTRQKMALLHGRVRRLEALLDDLLQYSRAGRGTEVVKRVDTQALVMDIVTLLAPPAEFIITVADTLPIFDTVEEPLRQVFMNLIGNAIKHHDRPTGRIEVAVRDQGEWYEFWVTDNGPGIPSAFHTKIFQMFQTLRPRDEVDGSGMGLAIAKKVVEGQGGTIRVESDAVHRGTTLRFTWRKQWQGRHP